MAARVQRHIPERRIRNTQCSAEFGSFTDFNAMAWPIATWILRNWAAGRPANLYCSFDVQRPVHIHKQTTSRGESCGAEPVSASAMCLLLAAWT